MYVRSVVLIDQQAFKLSGLVGFTVPTSLTSIGYGVFYYCQKLTAITIPT
jgi:hypothetical protein